MALLVINTTNPQPNGKFGDPAKIAFEKINTNFSDLQKAADMSSVSLVADQALYWNGTAWLPYVLSGAARNVLAAATITAMRGVLNAVGTAGNETIGGNKTFTGNTTFSGGVDGTLQSDALPTNSATRQWIRVAALPWPGNGASILQFDMTTGAIGNTGFVRDTVTASARGFAAGTVLTATIVDRMLSHERQGRVAYLADADMVGLRVATDGTGVELWIQHNPYNHGHSLIRRNASNVTYYGRTLQSQVSNTEPSGMFYATVKLIATTDDVSVASAAAVAAQTTANNAATAAAAARQMTGKNYLINGRFNINQRGFGGGALAANVYGFDRWKGGPSGGNVTVNQTTGVVTIVSGRVSQVIEAPGLAGRVVTVSLENPSAAIFVDVAGANATLAAGSGRRGVTLTVPTGSTGNIVVQLAGTNAAFSRVQLELGDTATEFEYRPFGLELLLCQRYFEVVPMSGSVGVTYTANGDTRSAPIPYKVTKRASPAVTGSGTMSVIGCGPSGAVINTDLGSISVSGDTSKARINGVANLSGISPAGAVMTWGDNTVGNYTAYVDSEL